MVDIINRERDGAAAGIFVWSSVDTSPRIMIGEDVERSIVNEAMEVSK